MQKIGIVGLGIMGKGMANNFLKKGHEVFVWNRTKSTVENLIKNGAIECNSPAEVSYKADLIFEVTASDESSKQVWLGENGILAGANSSKILVASATLSVEWIDELIQICHRKNFEFMDIALTGGRVGAETGSLTLLCGGSNENLNKIESALNSIAKKIFYFGKEGQGMRYKLILNFLQATHIVAFGQAMRIAKAQKMNLQKVAEALADRPGGIITDIAQKAYFKEPNPITFSIEWLTKDLKYAKKLAEDLNIEFLDYVLNEYKEAMENGFGGKDWASVNVLKKLNKT